MAEVFAPFIIERTIGNLTFYRMEGRSFVRKKSSLTRKKVLYSPQFERTRHYAGLMAKASRIGSRVYNALPAYWRQGWMYRSFTGEALTGLKAGKEEAEILQVLWQRYIEPVVNKQAPEMPIVAQPKRAYRKLNSNYWKSKTIKSARRKVNRQRLLHNAGLLARASKLGSKLYARLPNRYRGRSYYQYLTGLAMRLLKAEIGEEDILSELIPTLPSDDRCEPQAFKKKNVAVVNHRKGRYYFIALPGKCFSGATNTALPTACFRLMDYHYQINIIEKERSVTC